MYYFSYKYVIYKKNGEKIEGKIFLKILSKNETLSCNGTKFYAVALGLLPKTKKAFTQFLVRRLNTQTQ